MKKLITLVMLFALASIAFAADKADTIYNKQGQAVQVYAPNFTQALTAVQTSIDLTNTLAFEADSTADCKVYLSTTNSKTGKTAIRIQADMPRILGRGHNIGFAIYSGCTGTYSSMKGDWTGQ